jgi:hypothetical protein
MDTTPSPIVKDSVNEKDLIVEDPVAELQAIREELQRRIWQSDPSIWCMERLHDSLWTKQKEILNSIRDNRRTLVKSCHAIGKSFISAQAVAWWLDVWPVGSAFVVTSAPSGPQIKAILWREIGRAFMRGKLDGRVNQTEWYRKLDGKEELVAFGRKPDDFDPAAFQGIHARRVLVILDEANGIRGPLHEAAGSLIANDESKILMIGNPDDPNGEYFEASKPGSGWNVISISAFDSPNFTGEILPESVLRQLIGKTYVEEKRRKWAPLWKWTDDDRRCIPPEGVDPETDPQSNPMWKSKILGVFPEKTEAGGLIPITWIKAAQLRDLSATIKEKNATNELGADIGGGGDDSAVCHRHGDTYRIIRSNTEPDTMIQCGNIVDDLETTGATCVKVDKIGIGWGVVNRGQELGRPFIGINVGEGATDDNSASDERFLNLKAELWWNVRNLFERGLIDIDSEDEDLAGELCSIRYERLSSGKIKISDKHKDSKGKPIPSPNRAEALMLAAAPKRLTQEVAEVEVRWG